MSRQGQKRRRYPSKGRSWKRIFLVSCISCGVLVALLLIVAYFWIGSYLGSDDFRHKMELQAAKSLKAGSVEITPLSWGGASVGTDSIKVQGAGNMEKLDVTRLDAVVDRASLLDRHFRIKQISADAISVTMKTGKLPAPAAVTPANLPDAKPLDTPVIEVTEGGESAVEELQHDGQKSANWLKDYLLPLKYSVEDASIRDMNFTYIDGNRVYAVNHVAVRVSPELGNNEYRASLERGRIELPFSFMKRGTLEKAIVRYRPDRISVADCRILLDKRGTINAEGEWEKFDFRWWASAVARDIDCSIFLEEDWMKKLEGTIQATARAQGDRSGLLEVSGDMTVDRAVLTALPVLDTLNAFTLSSKFKRINFDKVSSNFKFSNGGWHFTDMVLVSEGLGQVEGWVKIGEDRSLSGQLKIGILPGMLSLIPGAEEKVFTQENNGGKLGYLWANLNLSGTLDNPREDLTARLMAAAKDRLLSSDGAKTVTNLLLNSAEKLLNGDQKTDDASKPDGKDESEPAKEKRGANATELLRGAGNAAGQLFGL